MAARLDDSTRAVVERHLARVSRGMAGDLADAYAEHAVVEQPFAPHGQGRIEGREALRAHFERAASTPIELRVDHLVVYETTDPEIVIAEYEYAGRVVPTDETFRVSNVQIVRVRGGAIVHSRDYHDHAAIAAVIAGAPPRKSGSGRAVRGALPPNDFGDAGGLDVV